VEKIALEHSIEKEKALPEIIGEIINTLQSEFPDCNFSIQEGRKIGSAIFLSVRIKGVNDAVVQRRLQELSRQYDLEMVAFDGNTNYIVHQRRINGKVNWRRWLYYPEAISGEAAAIVDKIVETSPELSQEVEANKKVIDSYEKYCNLIESAFETGVITKDEKAIVEGQAHQVSWGYSS